MRTTPVASAIPQSQQQNREMISDEQCLCVKPNTAEPYKTWVDGLGDEEKAQAYRTFFRNQADAMTRGRRAGGFFWTWNARGRVWGFSDLEKHGWIERSWWSAPNRTA